MMKHLITSLIEHNQKNRASYGDIYLQYPSIRQYLYEFGSIHLNLGRRSGHTKAMIELSKPWDIIITHSLQFAHSLKYNSVQCDTTNIDCIDYRRGTTFYPKTIWVDCASFITDEKKRNIYDVFGVHPEQTFIFLG